MIHFNLKNLSEIAPFVQMHEQTLHWFGLTDAELWIKWGRTTIYEYTGEAVEYWHKSTKYNDYYLARFLEDFTSLFAAINEPIPSQLYELASDIQTLNAIGEYFIAIDSEDESLNDANYEKYEKCRSWINARGMDSSHLIGGPYLCFFRCNDKIRIVWETEHTLENGLPIWTAKNGSIEMTYSDFKKEVIAFGESFFSEMDRQVKLAVEKEWGDITLDKTNLLKEHEERKKDFETAVELLNSEPTTNTNWSEILNLIEHHSLS